MAQRRPAYYITTDSMPGLEADYNLFFRKHGDPQFSSDPAAIDSDPQGSAPDIGAFEQ